MPRPSPARPLASTRGVLLALATAGLIGPALAGQAELRFEPAERYADLGRGTEAEAVQRVLSAHVQALAAHGLPAGQTLQLHFTDIDLAGEARPRAASAGPLRVMTGGADWPRLVLQYSLQGADGRTLAQGNDTLRDLDYLNEPMRVRDQGAYPYERRLLTRWFAQRFGEAPAAP